MQRLCLREDAWLFLPCFRKTGHSSSWTCAYWSCWTYADGITHPCSLCSHFHWWLFGLCTCCLHTQQRRNFTAFLGYSILGWNLYWSLAHLCTFQPWGEIYGWGTTIVLPFQRCHSLDICSSYTPAEWLCREVQSNFAWKSRSHAPTCLSAMIFLARCCWNWIAYL